MTISRRKFLEGVVGGLTALVGSKILAGCTRGVHPVGTISEGNYESAEKNYPGKAWIERIEMPKGDIYEVYEDDSAEGGFCLIQANPSERIHVGIETDVHEVEGWEFRLKDPTPNSKYDTITWNADPENPIPHMRVYNAEIGNKVRFLKDLTIELEKVECGRTPGYRLKINGEFVGSRYDARTIKGREFLVLGKTKDELTDNTLPYWFMDLEGLQEEVRGDGAVIFKNAHVYDAVKSK